jgi:hypothetical protein
MNIKTAMQITSETTPQKSGKVGNPHWSRGRSANPGGKTRAQLRYLDFHALFVETHARRPNPVEDALLRNAGACAARGEGRKVTAEHVVRTGRLLQSLLVTLGLSGGAPSKGDGKAFPDHGLQGGSP